MLDDDSIKKILKDKDLDGLLEILKSADLCYKSKALDVLKELNDERVVGPLLEMVGAGEMTYKVVWVLGELRDKRSVEPLLGLLKSDDRIVVGNTIDALAKIGDPTAVPALVEMLETDDPWLKHRTVEALTGFGGKSMGPLLDFFGSRARPDSVFFHTVEAIGLPAVLPLTRALEDVLPEKRANAAYALRLLGTEHELDKELTGALQKSVEILASLLEDENEMVRGNAALALAGLKETGSAEKLKAMLKDPAGFPRAMAASALALLQETSAVEDILPLLDDADRNVRAHAARALGLLKDMSARDGLVEKLSDASEEVRLSSLKALKQLGGEEIAPDIVELLNDASERVRLETLDTLKALDPAFAFDYIMKALDDQNSLVRLNATRLLGVGRDKRALGPLTKALNDSEAAVRRAAADALGEMGEPSSVDALIGSILPGRDSNYNILRAVKKLGQPTDVARAIKRLLEVGEYRILTTSAVKQLDSLLFDTLADSLEKGAREVQQNALKAVSLIEGEIHHRRLVEDVVKKIDDTDDRMVRWAAEAIRSIGTPAAEPLSRALETANERTRSILKEVFMEIRTPEVVGKVEQMLKGTTVSVTRETLGLLRTLKNVVSSTLAPSHGDESGDEKKADDEKKEG